MDTVPDTDRVAAADAYIDALATHDARNVPFAADCVRFEVGVKTGFSADHLRRSLTRGPQYQVIAATTDRTFRVAGDGYTPRSPWSPRRGSRVVAWWPTSTRRSSSRRPTAGSTTSGRGSARRSGGRPGSREPPRPRNTLWPWVVASTAQIRSMMVPVDSAPPAHMVISAVDLSVRSSSCSAVVINRLPVLPTG